MNTLGNILWVLLGGGIFLFVEYLLGGVLLCLTIVGIPFGLQCFKLSTLALLPFGKQIVREPSADGVLALILNIIWILMNGLAIVLTHLIFGVLCAITIIGLPFARQHMKLAALALTPFGHSYRESD